MAEDELDPEVDEGLEEGPGLSGLQKALLASAGVVLVGSVGARAVLAGGGEAAQSSAPPPGASGLVAPGAQSAAEAAEPGALEAFLPYMTEGSFFALMGFAVGYATRKLVRLLLIVVAVFFVGVQLLSSKGILDMDWQAALGWVNDLILNLKENQTVTEVLKDKIPTTGAFFAGLVIGFKRG